MKQHRARPGFLYAVIAVIAWIFADDIPAAHAVSLPAPNLEPPLQSVMVGPLEREYYLYRATSQKPMPLLVVLHGDAIPLNTIRKLGFEKLARRDSFAVVYPKGVKGYWMDGRKTDYALAQREVDDVAFLRALIDKLVKDGVADARHVFLTGISDGGIMAFRAACEMSDKLAGLATVMASMPGGYDTLCHPKGTLPVMMINSTNDSLIPWKGGNIRVAGSDSNFGEVLPVEKTLDFWRKQNRCGAKSKAGPRAKPTAETLKKLAGKPVTQAHSHVVKTAWDGCHVELHKIFGGGHGWPGIPTSVLYGSQYSMFNTPQMDATRQIWDFFKARVKK